MRLRFTKMHGAGNDFVVIDATRQALALSPSQVRFLGDRHRGVGADQILLVEPSRTPGVDFSYRIFNNSGDEVEHCGNGARCFLQFVREQGLTTQDRVRVQTVNRVLELWWDDHGQVSVDMGTPQFEPREVPFDDHGLIPRMESTLPWWTLQLPDGEHAQVAVVSMGNPHAVLRVSDVESAPVATWGPWIEHHPRFARRVNVGFLQVVSPSLARLRVFERGAGETLACGTGACAAAAVGRRAGWLNSPVDIQTLGGCLSIDWPLVPATSAMRMSGPAQTVFQGEIEL